MTEKSILYLFEKAYERFPDSEFVKSVEQYYIKHKRISDKQKAALEKIGNISKRKSRTSDFEHFTVSGHGFGLMAGVTRTWAYDELESDGGRWNDPDFDGYDYQGIPNFD